MYKDLLPIGSVVLLKGAQSKLLIIGRIVTDQKMEHIYDYVGVLYPIGITTDTEQYFFDREGIDTVYHYGYIGEEEISFKKDVLETLGELEIKDGRIEPKED